jgi:hypothetical protein
MATYLLHNTHRAEECDALTEELLGRGAVPLAIDGRDFFCTCPAGDHGGYVVAEGASAEAVLSQLPPAFRAGVRVLHGEVLSLQDLIASARRSI